MRLIVGLGNPGNRYAETRHNMGFRVCDLLAQRWGATPSGEKFSSQAAEARVGGERVMLLEPQTFMNLSGRAVLQAMGFYKATLDDVLVVCDDFNIPLGQLRLRRNGSHGGHNGLRDIIATVGDEFPRLRLGIGPVGRMDPADFCLTRFRESERADVEEMIGRAADAAETWMTSGIDAAMNRYNVRSNGPEEAQET